MGGSCSLYGGRRVAYRVMVGKYMEKRKLGRFRRRLEVNIKVDLQELGWHGPY